MGVTTHSNNLVQKHKGNAKTMLELGSQNTYFDCEPMGVAKEYYTKQGFEHCSLDANGEHDSEIVDLSTVLNLEPCDIVTDFGTSEHVSNYYNCWLNKHNGCKIGGLIISENPKVNNWKGHGFHYLTKEFYTELCNVAGYELIEVGEHAAMGNVTDGWNVYGVLRKVSDVFASETEFYALPFESTNRAIEFAKLEVTNAQNVTDNDAMVFATNIITISPETQHLSPEDYVNEVLSRFNGTYEDKPETPALETGNLTELECPKCKTVFEAHLMEGGNCPKCNLEFSYAEDTGDNIWVEWEKFTPEKPAPIIGNLTPPLSAEEFVELVANSPDIRTVPNDPAMDNWIEPEQPARKKRGRPSKNK